MFTIINYSTILPSNKSLTIFAWSDKAVSSVVFLLSVLGKVPTTSTISGVSVGLNISCVFSFCWVSSEFIISEGFWTSCCFQVSGACSISGACLT